MKARHLIFIFIQVLPLLGATKTENTNKKVERPKDVVTEIFESKGFRSIKLNPNRYKPPRKLLRKIENLSEQEKEKELLSWFSEKEKKSIRRLALFKIIWRVIFFVIGGAIMGVIAAYLGKTALKNVWALVIKYMPEFAKSVHKKFKKIPGPDQVKKPPNAIVAAIGLLANIEWVKQIGADSFLNKLASGLANVAPVLGMGQTATLLFLVRYLTIPIRFLWNLLINITKLVKLYYNPVHEDPMKKAEEMYVKSIHLYLEKPFVMKFLEEQLLNTRSGDMSKVNEIYELLKAYRAIPFGVKPVVYDQNRIDELFETYSPKMRRVAELIIAKIVVYSQTMEIDRPDLLAEIALKNVLLYGPPGTGKSHFFKLICMALDINYIPLFIINAGDVRGKAGDKIGHGQISAYGKALVSSADKNGRNFLNSVLIIEEIDKTPDSVQSFMHVFLDPKVKEIDDLYLHIQIPKIPFIFATTNFKDNLVPAINDRFALVEVGPISNKYKKMILIYHLIPDWVDFLSNPALQKKYGHSLEAEELEKHLTKKMVDFIDNNDTGPGMRTIEEELEKESMTLMVNIFQDNYEEEEWEEEEEEVEEWDDAEWEEEEEEIEESEKNEPIKDNVKKGWNDDGWEDGSWDDSLSEPENESLVWEEKLKSIPSRNDKPSEEEMVTLMESEEEQGEATTSEEEEWEEEEVEEWSDAEWEENQAEAV